MCGIAGVIARQKCNPACLPAHYSYLMLYAEQHRGQEAAGIAVETQGKIVVKKGLGLVTNVFNQKKVTALKGELAIGHVRYSTTGGSSINNAHPHLKEGNFSVAVSMNGNLVNTGALRCQLESEGVKFNSTSDAEIIAEMIARSKAATIEDAICEVCLNLQGAYSMLVLTPGKIIAVRDPFGIQPFVLGNMRNQNGEFYVLTSETCALDFLHAHFIREIEPGEILSIDSKRMFSRLMKTERKQKLCIFQFVYFCRPDSHLLGQYVYAVRERMGANLAKEYGDNGADISFPVPESGKHAGIGFASERGVPCEVGFTKNPYVGRTFISPEMRSYGVSLKLNPLRDKISGKSVEIIEDSIVRGTTTAGTIKMLRDAGAVEVSMCSASPPVIGSCFYGIDTADRKELIAADRSVEEVRQEIGADRLHYLSLEGMIEATGIPADKFCLACFNLDYPIPVPEEEKGKFRL